MKTFSSKEKFAIQYLCENEKVAKPFMWAQVEAFKQKMVEHLASLYQKMLRNAHSPSIFDAFFAFLNLFLHFYDPRFSIDALN